MTQSTPEPIEAVSALVDAALDDETRAENARQEAIYRQQNSGYDMGKFTAGPATLISNAELSELRTKARLIDWLTSQKRISLIHCEKRCLLLGQDIRTFEGPTVSAAIEAAMQGM